MMTTAQSDIAADLDAFSETTWFNSAFLVWPIAFPTRVFEARVLIQSSLDCHVQSHSSFRSIVRDIYPPRLYSVLLHAAIHWPLRDGSGSNIGGLSSRTNTHRMRCWRADGHRVCLDARFDEQKAPGALHRLDQRWHDYRCVFWCGASRSLDSNIWMGKCSWGLHRLTLWDNTKDSASSSGFKHHLPCCWVQYSSLPFRTAPGMSTWVDASCCRSWRRLIMPER